MAKMKVDKKQWQAFISRIETESLYSTQEISELLDFYYLERKRREG
jgi:hypothetical protein